MSLNIEQLIFLNDVSGIKEEVGRVGNNKIAKGSCKLS